MGYRILQKEKKVVQKTNMFFMKRGFQKHIKKVLVN